MRMKENVRNVSENMRLNSVNSKKKEKNEFVNIWLVKKYWTFTPSKNFIYLFLCVCIKWLILAKKSIWKQWHKGNSRWYWYVMVK